MNKDTMDIHELSKNMLAFRVKHNLSQDTFATLVRISRTHLNHIENETTKPSLKTYMIIQNVMDTYGKEEPMEPMESIKICELGLDITAFREKHQMNVLDFANLANTYDYVIEDIENGTTQWPPPRLTKRVLKVITTYGLKNIHASFTISDIQSGDVIVFEDTSAYTEFPDVAIVQKELKAIVYTYCTMSLYNLTTDFKVFNTTLRIKEIWRPIESAQCSYSPMYYEDGTLMYKYEVKHMTLKDIEEALGYEVILIDEDTAKDIEVD